MSENQAVSEEPRWRNDFAPFSDRELVLMAKVAQDWRSEVRGLKQALSEAWATIPAVFDGFHLADCPYVDVAARMIAVKKKHSALLESSP